MPSPADDVRSPVRREVEEVWPALSFYYPSLGFHELLRMPRWIRRAYIERLDELLAERELMAARAAVFPHLKPADARKYVDALRRRMRAPETDQRARLPVGMLRGMGIDVVKSKVKRRELLETVDQYNDK
jgi:hypothetical protein